jgi:hypothetical protein
MLADRFGGTPFDYWRVGASEREQLLELLGVESEVARAWQGLGADDDVVFTDEG